MLRELAPERGCHHSELLADLRCIGHELQGWAVSASTTRRAETNHSASLCLVRCSCWPLPS